MSEAASLNAIGLVMEFLQAKKFDAAAAALLEEIDALRGSLADEPQPEKAVAREFSQLESLLIRSSAAESAGPLTAVSGSHMAGRGLSVPHNVHVEQSFPFPEWHDPSLSPEEDAWTDDDALGYSKHSYSEEALLASVISERSSGSSRRHSAAPPSSKPRPLEKGHRDVDEDEEDEEDVRAAGDLAGEEGDDESELTTEPTSRSAEACAQLPMDSIKPSSDHRDLIFERYPHPAALAASLPPAAAPAAGKPQGSLADAASPSTLPTDPPLLAATSSLPACPPAADRGGGSARSEASGFSAPPLTVAVSLVAALDSGAEADADTEGGAVSTEDEAPSRPAAPSKAGATPAIRGPGVTGVAEGLELAGWHPPLPEYSGLESNDNGAELELDEEGEEEFGEEELGEEEIGEESDSAADELHTDRGGAVDAARYDGDTIVEEGEEEEEEELIEESDPEIDPYERASKEVGKYDTMYLKVVHERGHTGFEEHKDFPIRINSLIAARYQVKEYLGSAAFSKAVQCLDLHTGEMVCIKIIKNNKDFFDQSLDEIKLLAYLKYHDEADEHNIVHMLDFFYHKEHLFIVCELLRDNLYEFSRYNRESGGDPYFTLPRLRRIAKQVLS